MTPEELRALVGKTGRIVPANGKPAWDGLYTVIRVAPGIVVPDLMAGHRYSGPTLSVESVARRVQNYPDGRAPVTTEEPAERRESLPADWFVPQD
jgi:hypothetical protein